MAKSGEDPNKCPYLDQSNLHLEATESVALEDASREHDLALIRHLKEKISTANLQSLAPALQAEFIDSALQFPYLGRTARVNTQAALVDGVEAEDPRDQILLYNYIHFGGGPEPDSQWVGLESLPNSISKVRTLATYCENRLASFFTSMTEEQILHHCAPLQVQAISQSGTTAAMIVPVLPRIPQQLLFWDEEPEDGFEAKAKVLFPANVLSFLDIESLVFTAERMAEIISS